MSIPPQLIRVKRKATEETPVSYLRVQDLKRHRSEVFVYRRQEEEAAFASIPVPIQKPIIHIYQPTDQDQSCQRSKRKHTFDGEIKDVPARDLSKSPPLGTNEIGVLEQRRFHLSRPDTMLSTSSYPIQAHGGLTKKRSAPALFVERRIKRISSRTLEKLQSAAIAQHTTSTTGQPGSVDQSTLLATEGMDVNGIEHRRYKRPGVAKLVNKGTTSRAKPELPQPLANQWNVDMNRMAEEMNAFTLEQIGLNIQKAEQEQQQRAGPQKGGISSSQLKFKPKAPTKRYSERHPEGGLEPVDKGTEGVDAGVSDTDDDDYIIETYVRVPASKMGDNVPPQNVGLLVFDGEPDIEYFYGGGSDSEDEWAEDEEDENAENYYTADYPEDEVASDDEYNMNAYAYRTGNTSDLDEYGTDDEYDDLAYESKDAKGGFRTYVGKSSLTTNNV